MKAVFFEGKEKISLKNVEDPKFLDDEVLIRVCYCGICATDIALYNGDMPYIKRGMQNYPFIPGHEWAGEIVDVGSKVDLFKRGDRVTGDVSLGCGKCKECREGQYHLCKNKSAVGCYRNRPGAMAEYLVIPERHLYKFTSKISMLAAAVTEPLATALHGLARRKRSYDEKILITGAGFIGILAAQAAQLDKGSLVILTGRSKHKLETAKNCGVKYVVQESELDSLLTKLGLEGSIDFCMECSGNSSALRQCFKHVKPGGELSIISFYENENMPFDFDLATTKNLEIHGVLGSPNYFIPALSLIEKDLIQHAPLITKVFDIDDIETAIAYQIGRQTSPIKVMVKIGHD